jgi:small subunit ribosomal protein S14
MTHRITRDQKRRRLHLHHELLRVHYKAVIRDQNCPEEMRYRAVQHLNGLPRNSSPIRSHNRCVLTGRAHAVYRFSRLSRIKFRELAAQGLLMGVTKASW